MTPRVSSPPKGSDKLYSDLTISNLKKYESMPDKESRCSWAVRKHDHYIICGKKPNIRTLSKHGVANSGCIRCSVHVNRTSENAYYKIMESSGMIMDKEEELKPHDTTNTVSVAVVDVAVDAVGDVAVDAVGDVAVDAVGDVAVDAVDAVAESIERESRVPVLPTEHNTPTSKGKRTKRTRNVTFDMNNTETSTENDDTFFTKCADEISKKYSEYHKPVDMPVASKTLKAVLIDDIPHVLVGVRNNKLLNLDDVDAVDSDKQPFLTSKLLHPEYHRSIRNRCDEYVFNKVVNKPITYDDELTKINDKYNYHEMNSNLSKLGYFLGLNQERIMSSEPVADHAFEMVFDCYTMVLSVVKHIRYCYKVILAIEETCGHTNSFMGNHVLDKMCDNIKDIYNVLISTIVLYKNIIIKEYSLLHPFNSRVANEVKTRISYFKREYDDFMEHIREKMLKLKNIDLLSGSDATTRTQHIKG